MIHLFASATLILRDVERYAEFRANEGPHRLIQSPWTWFHLPNVPWNQRAEAVEPMIDTHCRTNVICCVDVDLPLLRLMKAVGQKRLAADELKVYNVFRLETKLKGYKSKFSHFDIPITEDGELGAHWEGGFFERMNELMGW